MTTTISQILGQHLALINNFVGKKTFLLAIATATLLGACMEDEDATKAGIFKGAAVNVAEGKAWSWIQRDAEGKPVSMGISIDAEALNSVPQGGSQGGGHGHHNMFNLPLPSEASVSPFRYVQLDWNPMGHEPEPIYGKPHFDFHFYMSEEAEVMAIPPYEAAAEKFDNWPAAEYFPATYFNAGGGVPQMGAHWVDTTSPELNGQPFTQTFIYGSYDGKVTFYEPMITLDFLKNNNSFERSIPVPAKFQKAGYYPTKMRMVKTNGVTEIILEGFVSREQS